MAFLGGLKKAMKGTFILPLFLICIHFTNKVTDAASESHLLTYPEEVHQRVLKKLSALHGNSLNGRAGEWSGWSSWSPCSRSCSTGVSTQYRECKPRLRQRNEQRTESQLENQCVGRYKRFQLCNVQKCPGGPVDFRAEQCATFNRTPFNRRFYSWEPFIDDPDSCTLNCRAAGMSFYATLNQSVIDGTPCGRLQLKRSHRELDRICVEGKCMKLGCDGLLGSGRGVDICGVCGGDNSTCRLISGVYTRANLPFGYNLIATLPPGAKNLSIYHIKPSKNYLALRELGGNYILNGPWGLNSSGNFEASGTVFTYSRPHAHGGDLLYSRGPTTHSLDVMLFYQNPNPGIKYEYRLPLSTVMHYPTGRRGGPRAEIQNQVVIKGRPRNRLKNKIAPGTLLKRKGNPFGPLVERFHLVYSLHSFPSSLLLADARTSDFPYTFYQINKNAPEANDDSYATKCTYSQLYQPCSSYSQFGLSLGYRNATVEPRLNLPRKEESSPNQNVNPFVPYSFKHAAKPKVFLSPHTWHLRSKTDIQYPTYKFRGIPKSTNHFSFNPTYSRLNSNSHRTNKFNSVLQQHGVSLFQDSSITSRMITNPPPKSMTLLSPSSSSSLAQATTEFANQLHLSPLAVVNRTFHNQILPATKHPPYISLLPLHRNLQRPKQGLFKQALENDRSPQYLEATRAAWSSQLGIERPPKAPPSKKQKSKHRYMWLQQGFTPCSQSCGGGTKSRRSNCVKKKKKSVEVPHEFCSHFPIPEEEVARCNVQPCPPEWEATEWSECSVSCGFGVQLRHLVCRQRSASEHRSLILADNECGKRANLPTAQVCQMRECDGPPRWDVEIWSECSSQCGLGTRTRRVICTNIDGEVDGKHCRERKPMTEEICDMGSCASDTWFFSEWDTKCKGPCGNGVQRRQVHCSGDALRGEHDAASCHRDLQPRDTRPCNNEKLCSGSWFSGPWSECDAECGTGRQRRAVVCVTWGRGRYKVARSTSVCEDAEERPLDARPCVVKCQDRWFTSQWSECSVACDGGVQRREVKCLDHKLQPSIHCTAPTKPDSRQSCNVYPCAGQETDPERIKNEVLDPSKHFRNSSSTPNKYNPGKNYEYSQHRHTSFITNGPSQTESAGTFEANRVQISEEIRGISKLSDHRSNSDEINVRGDDNDVYIIASQSQTRDVKNKVESRAPSSSSRISERLPDSTQLSDDCLDRMKNCKLVFKARLCKLKYYNKLCCKTCSQH